MPAPIVGGRYGRCTCAVISLVKSERDCKVRWKRLVRVFISSGNSYNNAFNDFVHGIGLSGVGGMYFQCVADKSASALLCKSFETCGKLLNNGHIEVCPTAFAVFDLIRKHRSVQNAHTPRIVTLFH